MIISVTYNHRDDDETVCYYSIKVFMCSLCCGCGLFCVSTVFVLLLFLCVSVSCVFCVLCLCACFVFLYGCFVDRLFYFILCLSRAGFFLPFRVLQAVTMRIVQRYIAEGAPDQVS